MMGRKEKQHPCAELLRVGLDSDLGGIWAPITDTGELTEKREFEFVPFPHWPTRTTNRSRPRSELERFGIRLETYGDLTGINHRDNKLSEFLPRDEIRFKGESWSPPEDVVPHNDPDFRHSTYGDYWKSVQGGRLPSTWRGVNPEDEELRIIFVEALAPLTGKSSFLAVRSEQRRCYGIHLIGSMLVAEFVDISDTGWDSAIANHSRNISPIVENFHFKRAKDEPVIVVGVPTQTFLAKRAVPLKIVTEGRTEITEAGRLLGVTEKDQVRFKFIYDQAAVEKILDLMK